MGVSSQMTQAVSGAVTASKQYILGRVLDSASLVWLRQRVRSLQLRHSLQLCRWDVTNLGIQVTLPVLPDRKYPKTRFKAVLPCHDRDGDLITIDLESRGHSSYRWSCPARIDILNTSPEFRSLYFAYTQDAVKSYHHLRLHDRRASWHGFTRCGTFPREITDNTVTLSSQGNTLIILVYANNDARSRFAVGLGYYLGSVWARVVCDQYPANQGVWTSCADFAKQAYDILWNAPIEKFYFLSHTDHVMDTHLPQSVWDARIVCGSSYQGYADVMIAIEQCPGCCFGPRQPTTSANALWLPWAQGRADVGHELELDERSACFRECSGESTALGDYGDLSDGNFKHCGNIFEDIQKHSGIESTDLVYHPVVSRVSSCRRVSHSRRAQTQHDILVTVPIKHFVNKQGNAEPTLKPLVLYRPKGLSLPNSEEFELLLKALSTRLAGKCLVTTVVQCSESYRVDDEGMQMDAGGDSALDGGVRSDQGTITSLCIIARPLAWRKEPACAERRKQFKNIREHFYAMANLHHLFEARAPQKSSRNKQKTNGTISFSTLFGLERLKNYVGEITFFQKLPSIMESQLHRKGSVEGNGSSEYTSNPSFIGLVVTRFESRFQPITGQSLCHEVEAPNLLKKCEVLGRKSLDETRKTQHEVKSISQTLSIGLLEHIRTSFLDASEENHPIQAGQPCHNHYDTVNVHSTVQEIVELQTKLNATQDEDEQRALEEDITGKILWFYWCGISSEVDQLLPKVVNYIRRKLGSMPSQLTSDCNPRRGFREIAEIIRKTPRTVCDDNVVHLQRIMFDAGAGVSRHELWLTARVAEQAKWLRVLRDTPVLGTQEATSGTSPEAPSTSIVHQMMDTGRRRL